MRFFQSRRGLLVKGWPAELGRYPAPCPTCTGNGYLFQMLVSGSDAGEVVDKFICPRCRGNGCEDRKDAVFEDIDITCYPESTTIRGRRGDVEGDGFSGTIPERP